MLGCVEQTCGPPDTRAEGVWQQQAVLACIMCVPCVPRAWRQNNRQGVGGWWSYASRREVDVAVDEHSNGMDTTNRNPLDMPHQQTHSPPESNLQAKSNFHFWGGGLWGV